MTRIVFIVVGGVDRPPHVHSSRFMMLDRHKIAADLYSLASSQFDPLSSLVREALDVIDGCLDSHPQSNVALSFNGGKDCASVSPSPSPSTD